MDPDEAVPYALPQEIRAPVIGWPALRDYWTRGGAPAPRPMRWWTCTPSRWAPNSRSRSHQMHWNGDIVGFGPGRHRQPRVTAVFRRRGHWRICHCVEAPAAPMLHLMKYYAQSVDDGFAATTK